MPRRRQGPVGQVVEVLTTEGPRALWDRLVDRWRERRLKSQFPLRSDPPAPGLRVPALLFLPTPPAPRLGGIQAQLLSRLEALESLQEPYAILYPESPCQYRLEVSAAGGHRWAQQVSGPRISIQRLGHPAFTETLRWAMDTIGAEILHFEHFGGAPLTAGIEVWRQGRRLVLSIHDFELFCPRPHLLERPSLGFCHYSRDMQRCTACLRQTWSVSAVYQSHRRELARELLATADAAIFPSAFLRDAYQRNLFPGLGPERQMVLEPPVALPRPLRSGAGEGLRTLGRELKNRWEVLHVAYSGSLQPHKGSAIFEKVVRKLGEDRRFRWSAFGRGDRSTLRRLGKLGVRVHGYYRWGTLPSLLQRHRVDLVLLLSIVPESYGLALTEARHAAVPVLAFDHGAIADRVREAGDGVLVAPASGAEGVVKALRGLARHRSEIERLARTGSGLEAGGTDPKKQVGELLSMYRELGAS